MIGLKVTLLSAALLPMAFQAQDFTVRPYARPVMIWVPPYAVSQSREQLKNTGLQAAITDLSLQFWVPNATGQAVLTKSADVTKEAVADFCNWGHTHGVRVMLCVYNGASSWDWALAKGAFDLRQDTFVESLVTEMVRNHLDGVDVDLEGPAQYEGDKPAFVEFIRKLSEKLHGMNKRLTVASFSYQWNAPNQGWWTELFPLVDGITSMGYESTGLASTDWSSYAAQISVAGSNAAKLQIGVPSSLDSWKGNSAQEQLNWIKTNGQVGVGIWDAQLRSPMWQSPIIWDILTQIRNGK